MDPLAACLPWHAHATTILLVHLVWATHRRLPWLEPCLDSWLAALLERKARRIDCHLLGAGVAADHVHVLVRHPPRVPVSTIAHRLKGASSHALHGRIPDARELHWQVGYWAESVGKNDVDALVSYLRRQRSHHAANTSGEPWEAALR